MSHKDSKNENSSDSETIFCIETSDSFLNNINQDTLFDQIDQKIKEEEENNDNNCFLEPISSKKSSKPKFLLILYRISDTFIVLIALLALIIAIASLFLLIFEITVSFYSVIIMNYVFFISSIISYTLAPIYQCFTGDWINFAFSFAQIFLSSPLIAFYIFYIMKSVISLADFFNDIPSLFKIIFEGFIGIGKDVHMPYFKNFLEAEYELVFDLCSALKMIGLFLLSLVYAAFSLGFAYVLFCLDKTIILLGSILYIINTVQIFILITPSYLYFFQFSLGKKCKKINFVEKLINEINDIKNLFNESELSESEKEFENNFQSINQDYNNSSFSEEFNSMMDYKFNNIASSSGEEEEEYYSDDEIYVKKKNDEPQNQKLIDDSDISDFVNESKSTENKMTYYLKTLTHLALADDYISLYEYSTSLACDKHKKSRKILLLYIFLILNLLEISYDIYQLIQNYSIHFLFSIIIRSLFIPLFSFYNIFVMILNRPKDKTLNKVLNIACVLTVIISIVLIFIFIFASAYQSKYRLNNLEYIPLPNNTVIIDKDMINHPICNYKIFNVSSFDAFGYSLGGYDIKRNKTIFDNQMKTFFGENYTNHISYTTHEFLKHFLFIKYYDSSINTHIFAFRGYSTRGEVAFQFELFAIQYIIPFFEDIVPFYGFLNNNWLSFYTDFLNSFGLTFFDNNNLIIKYVNSIIDIYNKEELDKNENVLFTGLNCGGVIAKIVGTILHRKSISFLSFPINNDLFQTMFDFSPSYISLVTNVYNIDGFFSSQEPSYATNIGINMPVLDSSKFCTSSFCEIVSRIDNVYRTFCTMSELCGNGNRFNYYCESIIGENNLEKIRKNLNEIE